MSFTTTDAKRICYDRTTKDYAAYYENQVIGFYNSYLEAETALDEFVSDLARQTAIEDADQAALAAEQAQDEPPLWACKACGGEHHIQNCPQIWTYLRATPDQVDVCVSCGDQLGREGPGVCGACLEWEHGYIDRSEPPITGLVLADDDLIRQEQLTADHARIAA